MMIVMMKSLMILTQKIQAVTSTSCQVRSSDSYFLTPFSLYTFDEDKGGVRKIKMEIFNGICH